MKERYFSPMCEALELKLEGVITASGGDVVPTSNPFGGTEEVW